MSFNPQEFDSEDLKAEINIIPLVDIMLVLLIIFMVAAPLMNDSVDVKLPKAQAKAATVDESNLILTIKKDETLYLGKTQLGLGDLSKKLPGFLENREKKDLIIKADENVPHGFVVKVMAVAQNSGVSRISFLTDSSK
jgi:biopolymer transport protein TolR